jgi:hypothetical protein
MSLERLGFLIIGLNAICVGVLLAAAGSGC